MLLPKKAAPTVINPSSKNANPALWIRCPHQVTYPSVARPKRRLNQRKKAPNGPHAGFRGFSNIAERGAQSKSIERREQNRNSNRDRKLFIELSGNPGDKSRRNKDRRQDQADGNDWP